MNSWRLSSVRWPVAVSARIAPAHSCSVSPTSVTKACRWETSASISSRRRGSGVPAKLASTCSVISDAVIGRSAIAPD